MKRPNGLKNLLLNERGSVSVEAVLMFPMLVWAYIAMFVFFEGLREDNINLKSTYAVADLLSREDQLIDQTYVQGMAAVYQWLSRTANPISLRVSVVTYDAVNDEHDLVCSIKWGEKNELSEEEVATTITPHVPLMPNAGTAIVVETWATYTPLHEDFAIMEVGLGESEIHNLVVTQPRFSPQMNCEGVGDGTGSDHDDQVDGSDEITIDIDPDDDGDATDS